MGDTLAPGGGTSVPGGGTSVPGGEGVPKSYVTEILTSSCRATFSMSLPTRWRAPRSSTLLLPRSSFVSDLFNCRRKRVSCQRSVQLSATCSTVREKVSTVRDLFNCQRESVNCQRYVQLSERSVSCQRSAQLTAICSTVRENVSTVRDLFNCQRSIQLSVTCSTIKEKVSTVSNLFNCQGKSVNCCHTQINGIC